MLPEGQYGAFAMKDGSVFICSERSMLNMSYQVGAAHTGQCPVRRPALLLLGFLLWAKNRTPRSDCYVVRLRTVQAPLRMCTRAESLRLRQRCFAVC